MKKTCLKTVCIVLAGAVLLSGCGSVKEQEKEREGVGKEISLSGKDRAVPFDFQVDAQTFALSVQVNGQTIPVSGGGKARTAENYEEKGEIISWNYPEDGIRVCLTPKETYLEVQITSDKREDNSFVWPYIAADQYYLPLGEGKRVPADSGDWIRFLDRQEVQVMERLSMPFWASAMGEYSVLFIMEDPYRTKMNFSAQPELAFAVSHEYPEIDEEKTNTYRIYVTENDPVNCAKIYRSYVQEKGQLVTLEQKAEQNPEIRKLYGAPFVYFWGEFVISADDVDWEGFRRSLDLPVMEYLSSFADEIENGSEYIQTLEDMREQDYAAEYQKNVICSYLSQVLRLEEFWNPDIFAQTVPGMDSLLEAGYDSLTDVERLELHKYALYVNLPGVFRDPESWMDSSTVDVLRDMKDSGIDHAWIGLNSWGQAYAKPELAEEAAKLGYLIASYDSYHSIHAPGEEQWETAQFDDPSLYENGTVTDRNGEKEKGFQNVGRKLNPVLSMPAVQARMEKIMSNNLPFHSWFIDCDATGEIYDDYTPEHITTQEQDLAARLERMAYIRDRYGLVIGSEGGNDFAAPVIAFAHGIELPSFSWMDEEYHYSCVP